MLVYITQRVFTHGIECMEAGEIGRWQNEAFENGDRENPLSRTVRFRGLDWHTSWTEAVYMARKKYAKRLFDMKKDYERVKQEYSRYFRNGDLAKNPYPSPHIEIGKLAQLSPDERRKRGRPRKHPLAVEPIPADPQAQPDPLENI